MHLFSQYGLIYMSSISKKGFMIFGVDLMVVLFDLRDKDIENIK
jgi:hypothetical protein